jgi:hypothetical protein
MTVSLVVRDSGGVAMPSPSRNLNPTQVSAYLAEKYGIKRSPKTLAKERCLGGGPPFYKANRAVLYPESGLDTWAVNLLGPLVRSTSEATQSAA